MRTSTPALIAVDSVSSVALTSAARAALASIDRRKRSGISHWDASGLFEELGWTGFATPHLLARHGWLAAGLTLGVLWATWHVAADVPDNAAAWGDQWPWRVRKPPGWLATCETARPRRP